MPEQSTSQFSDGAAYEKLMGRWSRKIGRQFLTWCDVEPGKSWLDVGCGTGAFTQEILELSNPHSVDGIDPSPQQIAFAQNRAATAAAKFHVGDAQKLPFADGTFDAAVMALVVVFLPDPLLGVRELKRVARPGGIVSAYMWDLPAGGIHLAPIYRALKDVGLQGPTPPHAAVSTREGMNDLWSAAGVKNIESTVLSIDVVFPDFEIFWSDNTLLAGPLGQYIKKLDAETIEAVQKRLKQILPISTDGSITYSAFANAVKGRA